MHINTPVWGQLVDSVWVLTRLTSRLMGYHPSQSILPKVSVCDQSARSAAETANRREPQQWGQGSEVTPVPTVAEGVCLCSLSPHQHTRGVWPPVNDWDCVNLVSVKTNLSRLVWIWECGSSVNLHDLLKSPKVQIIFSLRMTLFQSLTPLNLISHCNAWVAN